MEPMMISLKVLSTAAALALILPMAAPTASLAQHAHGGGGHGGGGHPGGGFHPGGGGFHGGGAHFSGGGFHGGGFHGRGGGGFIPGAVAGAVIGGAIASGGYGYYGDPGYAYGPGYDDQYYDDGGGVVAGPAQGGDDAIGYCMQTYRSYDPRSGTYLGNDGYRHPCP
jgi:BA14K-like protein